MPAEQLGRQTYFSPTSSDQDWLKLPSVKMGPGDSARSHSAHEYISISEIEEGINIYINLLDLMCHMMVSEAQLKSLSFEHQLEH